MSALQPRLNELRAQPHSQALAARLQLAELLLERAASARDSVAALLNQKAEALLAEAEQTQATEPVESAIAAEEKPSPLAQLLEDFRSTDDNNEAPVSELDKKIQEQNARWLAAAEPPISVQAKPETERGLRAARQLKHQQGRNARRSKVQFALDSRPDDPGPLNPQMLAVQILSQIQSVSPGYLEHLVTYMETLAVLDQKSSAKGKKTTRAAKTS